MYCLDATKQTKVYKGKFSIVCSSVCACTQETTVPYINSISVHLSIVSVYIKPTQKTVMNLFTLNFLLETTRLLCNKTSASHLLTRPQASYTQSFHPKSGTWYKLLPTTYQAMDLLHYVFLQILQALLSPSSFVNIQNECIFHTYCMVCYMIAIYWKNLERSLIVSIVYT